MPKIIDLSSTGIGNSAGLDNKPKQQCDLCSKFYLVVIRSCEVAKNPQIFLTRANQRIR